MKKLNNIFKILLVVLLLTSCSKNEVKHDSRFTRPVETKLAVVVISSLGHELVDGDPEQMGDCLMYKTIIKKLTVRRLICGDYILTSYENGKIMRKDLKTK